MRWTGRSPLSPLMLAPSDGVIACLTAGKSGRSPGTFSGTELVKATQYTAEVAKVGVEPKPAALSMEVVHTRTIPNVGIASDLLQHSRRTPVDVC